MGAKISYLKTQKKNVFLSQVSQLKDDVQELTNQQVNKDLHIQQLSTVVEAMGESVSASRPTPEQEAQTRKILDENAELRVSVAYFVLCELCVCKFGQDTSDKRLFLLHINFLFNFNCNSNSIMHTINF